MTLEQAKNILFCTTDKEFAENIVKSFNNYKKVKGQLSRAKNDLAVKDILISEISKASRKKISELNGEVLSLQKK